ncbi:MAG: glycosyltransferase [Thermodesulfobacteriota bacterium]
MRTGTLVLLVLVAVSAIGIWAIPNIPRHEPEWPAKIRGLSFTPLRPGNNPEKDRWPTAEEIQADLNMLEGKTHSLRTYGVEGSLGEIPSLARGMDFSLTVGAWLYDDEEKNEAEIEKLIQITNEHPNVTRVIVGNESLLHDQVRFYQLVNYLERVRKAVHVPVSTAEPWHVWLSDQRLAKHVDFISVQLLPWWEGVPLAGAVDFVAARYADIQRLYPKKSILISEVGWPSNGLIRFPKAPDSAVEANFLFKHITPTNPAQTADNASFFERHLQSSIPSVANQAAFVRRFLDRAEKEGYDYFLLEAFDQPWKVGVEGAIGAYWGILDANRNPKFPWTGPVSGLENWPVRALVSVMLAVIGLCVLLMDGDTLAMKGKTFLAVMSVLLACGTVYVVDFYGNQYLTLFTLVVGMVLVLGIAGTVALLLVEAHELAETAWVNRRRRAIEPAGADASVLPKVSVHVPAYNEPPEMLIETLSALARLDYPDYEVLVIDNNTKDSAVWKPVEAECARLGEKFRFFHVDKLDGFKAGALNFATRHTHPDAEVIAVIDSDYVVDAAWLKDLVPHFGASKVAIVQAPQDYRNPQEDMFKSVCFSEYAGFFHIGMVTRNERNAIIQHGTMTMVRKSVLEEVGGWAEWCITEDAELGLRVFERGYEALYINKSYGRGLLPDRFTDYCTQRFRWAYGAIQIMRRHVRGLVGLDPSKLTNGQRYHFLAGWYPWLADGVNLLWTLLALAWSVGIIASSHWFGPPPSVFVLATIAVFAFKVHKTVYLYRVTMKSTPGQTLGAVIAGMALSHTVAKAVLTGCRTTGRPFIRTPKCENRPRIVQAFAAASEEAWLMLGLWVCATAVAVTQGRLFPAALLWSAALIVQSIPYLAAVTLSMVNAAPSMIPAWATTARGRFADAWGRLAAAYSGVRYQSPQVGARANAATGHFDWRRENG